MLDQALLDAEKLIDLFCDLTSKALDQDPLEECAELELTHAQVLALRFLARHRPTFVGDLADGLSISNPAATKAVDRLVAKRLVDRTENPGDRRVADLTITEEGLAAFNRLRGARRDRLQAYLDRMDPEDRRGLARGLRAFLTAAFMHDRSLITRICERAGTEHNPHCVVNQAHLALIGTEIPKT